MKRVQKITAIILSVLFCISMASDTVHAGDGDQSAACTIHQELDVSDCRQGDVITLSVYLQGDLASDGLQVASLAGAVEYDTSLFTVEKSDVLPVESDSASTKAFDQSDCSFRVKYNSNVTVDGKEPILRFKLHVNEKATTGKTTICVTHLEWKFGEGETYEIEHWVPSSVIISEPETEVVPGDVNLDHKITLIDVKYIMQYCNGRKTLNDQQKKNADVNGDGKVNLIDAKLIMKSCNGEISDGTPQTKTSSYKKTISRSYTNLKQKENDTKTKGYTVTIYNGILTVKSDCTIKVSGKNVFFVNIENEDEPEIYHSLHGKYKSRDACSLSATVKLKKGTYSIRAGNNGLAQGKKASFSMKSNKTNLKLTKTGKEHAWLSWEVKF